MKIIYRVRINIRYNNKIYTDMVHEDIVDFCSLLDAEDYSKSVEKNYKDNGFSNDMFRIDVYKAVVSENQTHYQE